MKSQGEIAADFCDRLTAEGVRYVIGGSLASGAWGDQRQTHDVDIEVWVSPENVESFLKTCDPPFEVYPPEVYREVHGRSEFRMVQVMQVEELLKFDCFIQGLSSFEEEAYDRAVTLEIVPGREVRVASAEHILVRKLRWYEIGNRASERQWRDMLGIARLSRDLDWRVIERWAEMLGVEEVLRLLREEI